ncbi:MAG: 5-deoxy-glucuronate isomerase, partial [Mogibacterium sp.]|nr:5-deoxy-glucuronate isomerase [Mogibacterium sp.]
MSSYIEKNDLKQGYNVYIDSAVDDKGTLMDVGLLIMEEGDTWKYHEKDKEVALLLFEGKVTYSWDGKSCEAERPNCFHHEAYCLLASCDTEITLTAQAHSEIFVQATKNDNKYESVMYTPDTVQTQHAGSNGELMGCMQREIKTFFD